MLSHDRPQDRARVCQQLPPVLTRQPARGALQLAQPAGGIAGRDLAQRQSRSLHRVLVGVAGLALGIRRERGLEAALQKQRSEEHTSELQSQSNLVCRLLLEKKKK